MKNLLVILIMSLSTLSADACVYGKGFLPENDLNIPVYGMQTFGVRGIAEADFNDVIEKVESVYSSIVRGYGGNLKIERLWSDGTVNAMASRQGSTYLVKMFGGLARHESITRDGFALVACHEVGHHIGGVPRYSDPSSGVDWASSEGQSDYFAVTKCLRKIFMSDDNEAIIKKMQVDPIASAKCESQFSIANDIAICKRVAMAGFSSSSLFAKLSNSTLPKFDAPDPNVVSSTYESHPQYQCRLDTYFQGANCSVQEDVEIGQQDANVGTCNRKDKFTEGLRPLCWFKPAGGDDGGGGNPPPNPTDTAKMPTVNGQSSISASNPNTMIPIDINVGAFNGAAHIAIEFSKANQAFSNPNSMAPDRVNGLRVEVYPQLVGTYKLIPMRHLPGWGQYQMRVIALDRNKKPVSKNSNSFTINLRP